MASLRTQYQAYMPDEYYDNKTHPAVMKMVGKPGDMAHCMRQLREQCAKIYPTEATRDDLLDRCLLMEVRERE